jgi:AraC family transcriptional regulator
MSAKQPLVVDRADWHKLLPNPPLLTSFQSSWRHIHLAHFQQPLIDFPEISSPQHTVVIPIGHQIPNRQAVEMNIFLEGRAEIVSFHEKDYTNGYIQIYPAKLPCGLRSDSTPGMLEWLHCYLEPTFLAQIAPESVNPDRVELLFTLKKADLLIQQIGLALKAGLETDGGGDRFYADAMATALSAHLVRHYSTRKHHFQEYEDGLSKRKLQQAIAYMQAHLGENLSLNDIASELGMSQYYFCRLFKQSTGMSPHQYLIHQRVERAKYLLNQPERSIASIAVECGFANQSHFARYFRQCTGMNPKQFRKTVL